MSNPVRCIISHPTPPMYPPTHFPFRVARRLPSEEVFNTKASDLGLSSKDTVVVYAKKGSFSAPRCWWTFRTFGHERVHILDGGFPAWEASGGR